MVVLSIHFPLFIECSIVRNCPALADKLPVSNGIAICGFAQDIGPVFADDR